MGFYIEKIVSAEYGGSTLYHFLREGMGLTKKEISRAKFLSDGICVNGERKKVTVEVRAGDRIRVMTESEAAITSHLKPSVTRLQLLYEDEAVLVVNKPAGISVHPSGRQTFEADTLANRLVYYLREKGEDGIIRIVGRLDRDTSGVVLAAKNRTAAARLMRQREQGILRKTYLALTDGIPEPEAAYICKALKSDPEDKTRMLICGSEDTNAKYAKTFYETVNKWKIQNTALVRLQLETGRTHQIRVHMQSIGCPLLGDPLYGRKEGKDRIGRTALHAAVLNFCQPFTGVPLSVEAELPKDIVRFMDDVLE